MKLGLFYWNIRFENCYYSHAIPVLWKIRDCKRVFDEKQIYCETLSPIIKYQSLKVKKCTKKCTKTQQGSSVRRLVYVTCYKLFSS